MTFLPIVTRELRVAARKRSTFWLRLAAAMVALAVGFGCLLLSLVRGFFTPPQLGHGLFNVLTWLNLGVALSAGLFFTSDSLSEEKREGTLGLLFLTDLRGYDVVLGKLMATSLRGGFALLAVFPVLALTLLLGGVSGLVFWQTVLAIVNALFFSLAGGLFVSTITRDSQVALVRTLGLLVLLLAAGPLADSAIATAKDRAFVPLLSLASPGFAFVEASSGRGLFWLALLANQVTAWSLLGAASWLAPRKWEDRTIQLSPARLRRAQWWRYGSAGRRGVLRRKLLDLNPALWLAARERWQAFAVWLLAGAVVAASLALWLAKLPVEVWAIGSSLSSLVVLLLYLWTTSQACRFFVDARRSGVLELLLATPLPSPQIANGGWQALLRSFGPPVLLLVLAGGVAQALGQRATWGNLASTIGVAPFGFAAMLGVSLLGAVATLANLTALTWFGLWMGVTSKSVPLATLKTLLFVQIIPSAVFGFVAGMTIPLLMLIPLSQGKSAAPTQFMVWMPLLSTGVSAVLSVAKDVAFVVWARRKLFGDFRERALPTVAPVRPPVAPPVVPALPGS